MPLKVTHLQTVGGTVELGDFNVLVGPNNCGKSQTLRDVREFVVTGVSTNLVVAKQIDLQLPDQVEGMNGLRFLPHASPGHRRVLGVSFDLQSRHEFAPHDGWLEQAFTARNKVNLLQNLGRFWVAHLDAESRLRLASPVDCYDRRNETPSNALQAFFAEGEVAQTQLRAAFNDAFGMDVALDWAAMRRWYLRVGRSFGVIPDSLDQLNTLLQNAPDLSVQGDGYRSFAGVVLAMLTFHRRLLLLDEPEAFLHPAQARVLGRWLGERSKSGTSQIILATHNSDFLWGLVSANPEVRVIRLNRTGDTTRYHLVASATTKDLVQSPLLSSQPVLDALFQEGVAVSEGDPDRAVYQSVAHRCLANKDGEGILFIHANGKDAISVPVALLRSAGTPVCAVMDFDIFNSAKVLGEVYQALTGTEIGQELLTLRNQVAEAVEKRSEDDLFTEMKVAVDSWKTSASTDFREARRSLRAIADKASKWDQAKAKGVDALEGPARESATVLIAKCREAGIFVVSKGELESWIAMGIAKGKQWNRAALEKLHAGDCPPELREFVQAIVEYLRGDHPTHSAGPPDSPGRAAQ